MDQLLGTLDFAAKKHASQRRRDAVKTPYVNHLIGVANLISNVGGEQDLATLQAGVLHDVVEDTGTTLDEIKTNFGEEVASIVAEVTDDRSLPKLERKKQQIIHVAHASKAAKLVKLADKLYNLSDLLNNPHPDWSRTTIQGYFVWCYFVVEGMRGTNAALEAALDKIFAATVTRGPEEPYLTIPNGDKNELLADYYASLVVK